MGRANPPGEPLFVEIRNYIIDGFAQGIQFQQSKLMVIDILRDQGSPMGDDGIPPPHHNELHAVPAQQPQDISRLMHISF